MRPLITLFAKAPVAGRVKTRLLRVMDAVSAAELHSAFVRDMLELLQSLSAVADIELSTDVPTEAWVEFDVHRCVQAKGDLGERIFHAIASALASERNKAVILGSDSPTLPAAHIQALLDTNADVALGPTEDGGYYAIACRRTVPGMFHGVRWSAPETLATTAEAVNRCGLTVDVGPPWFDVDEPDDLVRLIRDGAHPRHTANWLRANAHVLKGNYDLCR